MHGVHSSSNNYNYGGNLYEDIAFYRHITCTTDLNICLTMYCTTHVHVTCLSLFLYICLHLSPREVQCLSPRLLTSLSLILHSFTETLLQYIAMAAYGSVQCNVYFLFSARSITFSVTCHQYWYNSSYILFCYAQYTMFVELLPVNVFCI